MQYKYLRDYLFSTMKWKYFNFGKIQYLYALSSSKNIKPVYFTPEGQCSELTNDLIFI